MFGLCGLFSEATRFLKAVIGCLCCVLIAGPVMIIVGVVMIVAPNNRAEQVAAYNQAIASFDTSVMTGWGGTIYGQDVQRVVAPITVNGNLQDVNTGTSVYLTASVNYLSSPVSFIVGPVPTFSRQPTYSYTKNTKISCSGSSSCSSSTMASKCSSDNGVWNGGSCSKGSSCSGCIVTYYLQQYCVVVTNTTGSWQVDTVKQTCRYPFNSQSMDQTFTTGSNSPNYVPFRVYTSTDPYLTLQQQTEGTDNFGLTRSQQTAIGIGLAVGGAAMVFIVGGSGYCVYKVLTRNQNQSTAAVPAMNAQSPQYAQPQYAQPLYGQQQPQSYAPQPGAYAQQPGPYPQQPAPYAQQPGPYAQQPGPYYQQPGPGPYPPPQQYQPAYGQAPTQPQSPYCGQPAPYVQPAQIY